MKKILLSGFLMLFCLAATFAQTPSNYFEVYTKPAYSHPSGRFILNRDSILARINNVPDSTSTFATFVVSTDNPANLDSVTFTLTNSQSQSVYSSSMNFSTLSSSSGYKVSGNTVYFTVGPYPYLKHFSATAQLKYAGNPAGSVRSFAKN